MEVPSGMKYLPPTTVSFIAFKAKPYGQDLPENRNTGAGGESLSDSFRI